VIKSLLRYPGGKTRAIKHLDPFVPEGTKELCSPFFGGGSFEFHLINKGLSVYAADIFQPLVSFWQEALENPEALASEVEEYYPCSKELFKEIQKEHISVEDRFFQAAMFYVLNRCSFSGTTASGGMSNNHPRFTTSSIVRLRDWKCPKKSLSIDTVSFEDFIPLHKDKLFYLDPPYLISNYLYGNKGDTHKGFNHSLLREILNTIPKWFLSYNDCEEIRELYSEYLILPLEWKYGMSANKNSSEIIILSKELEHDYSIKKRT
jgi:DNA adenine methylase